MPKTCLFLGLALAALSLSASAQPSPVGSPSPTLEGYTAVTVSVVGAEPIPFLGTDGKYHVVYELVLQNTTAIPATITELKVIDAVSSQRVLASYSGPGLAATRCPPSMTCNRLRSLSAAPVGNTTLPPQESRLLYVDFAVEERGQVPRSVLHWLHAKAATRPGARSPTEAKATEYAVAPLAISTRKPVSIGPPVRGYDWVAINGCCEPGWPHRTSVQAFNGALRNPQRFAIDWKQLNDQGSFYKGDRTKNESYTDYGHSILAVADGTVVEILDGIKTNSPGVLPAKERPSEITLQNVEGNHLVLDLGQGVYAFYAHLMPGSLRVSKGDRVQRGQELAKLGNTGNSSASHLHFHLSDAASPLAGNGIPYVIDKFSYSGQIDLQVWERADDYLTGTFFRHRDPLARQGSSRQAQLPLSWSVVAF